MIVALRLTPCWQWMKTAPLEYGPPEVDEYGEYVGYTPADLEGRGR